MRRADLSPSTGSPARSLLLGPAGRSQGSVAPSVVSENVCLWPACPRVCGEGATVTVLPVAAELLLRAGQACTKTRARRRLDGQQAFNSDSVTLPPRADFVQELYVKELRAYKPKPAVSSKTFSTHGGPAPA